MRKKFKKRLFGTAKAVTLGGVCCFVIYGTLLLGTTKSILRMQTTRIDL